MVTNQLTDLTSFEIKDGYTLNKIYENFMSKRTIKAFPKKLHNVYMSYINHYDKTVEEFLAYIFKI